MAKWIQSADDIKELLDRFDTFLCDCDGVIWKGHALIPGVDTVLDALRSMAWQGKRVIFVTNNSTKSREQYLEKFKRVGLTAQKHLQHDVFGSSYAVAAYLKFMGFTQKVYVVGESGIQLELEEAGIRWIGGEHDRETCTQEQASKLPLDPEGVVGLDTHINYKKCALAMSYLRENPQCLFLATNADATFPHEHRLLPGAGTCVAMIEACSGRKAQVIGKPEKFALELIIQDQHLNKDRTIMVGDRLDTDILFGIRGGISTVLVFTEEDMRQASFKPTYCCTSFGELSKFL